MDTTKVALALKMGRVLKMVGKGLNDAISFAHIELTIEQFVLLGTINDKKEITQQDLSLLLKKDKSGILRLTDELERKKLVVRIPQSSDRRKKILILTKKGGEILNQVLEIEANVIEQLLQGITEQELNIFSNVLSKIQKNEL